MIKIHGYLHLNIMGTWEHHGGTAYGAFDSLPLIVYLTVGIHDGLAWAGQWQIIQLGHGLLLCKWSEMEGGRDGTLPQQYLAIRSLGVYKSTHNVLCGSILLI